MGEREFKQYDFEHPSRLFILEDVLKCLLGGPFFYKPYYRTFRLKGNENVLDFGCGGGAGSRCLARMLNKGGHLTCIDSSKYWMDKARQRLARYTNVECQTGDIRKLNIPDSSFDIISAIYVIHEIAPEDRQATLNTLSRSLKDKGTIFIRELAEKSHGISVDELRTLALDAGLKVIEHKETKMDYQEKYQKVILK